MAAPEVTCEQCHHVRAFKLDDRWHGGLKWCRVKSNMPSAHVVNPKKPRSCAVYIPATETENDQSV